MKLAAIAIAAGLALGATLPVQAQQRQGESIGQKADRTFDRMESAIGRGVDKARDATGNAKREGRQEAREARQDARHAKDSAKGAKHDAKQAGRHDRDDTRAMGAGRRDAQDDRTQANDRRARMDEAYDNWKRQPRS